MMILILGGHRLHRLMDRLQGVEESLGRIERKLRIVIQKENEMAGELDNLQTEVNETGTVVDSAIVLLNGLKAALDAAIASGDMSRVTAIAAQLDAKTNELASAVANIPNP